MKALLLGLATALTLCTLPACRNDDALDIETADDFSAFLQDEADAQGIPALSVLVFEGEEVVFEEHLGQSDVEAGRTLEPDDLFLMASVSKVVTGVALLQLHEDGRFGLDEDVSAYLPFGVSVPGQSAPVTFRSLLTHSSGIADGPALDGQYYYGEDSPVALGDFLRDYLVPGGQYYSAADNFHDFAPGTRHEYSNVGTALVGFLVEEISGVPFDAYCRANVFEPLGMTRTYWRLGEAQASGATLVRPYTASRNGLEPLRHYTFTDYPNGGLRSTARDMHRLFAALAQDGSAYAHQLLASGTATAMRTTQLPGIDAEVGLHLFVMDAARGLWGHDGGEDGVATIVAFDPETRVGAVVLANEGDAELEEILAAAYDLGAGM